MSKEKSGIVGVYAGREVTAQDIADAFSELEAAQNAQRWIPVTERLPENEQRVFVCATRKLSDGRVLQIRSMAMYEDGSMPTEKSGCLSSRA